MCDNTFRVQSFENILYINDKKGNTLTFENRHSSCFIITLKGKIRFTFEDVVIVSDESGGIFIPEGIGYKNECLEDAQSIVINFSLFGFLPPCKLKHIDPKAVKKIYEDIKKYSFEESRYAEYYILSQIYLLACELFGDDTAKSDKQILAEKAGSYIRKEYENPRLQISDIANHCNISEVYLRKIFSSVYGKSPYEFLTEVRMETAYRLVLEKIPVKEVAFLVGYADIYQFSRAYKRYFGHAPTIKNPTE